MKGGVMHAKRVLLLEYDLGALALLLIGTGAAALLVISGF
jgi:hypothetical protein